jgi:hypothetical protein
VKVQVVYFDGCPSWHAAAERMRHALDATGHAAVVVELVEVSSPEDAVALRFAGSPTLLVDGKDLFPGAAPIAAMACRLYAGPSGFSDAPTLDALSAALRGLPPQE